MDITILGCGNIGGTIGKKWAGAGHTVTFGVRRPDEAETKELVGALGPRASLTTIDAAMQAAAPVVLFAIPGSAVSEAVAAHSAALAGKIVIDATNKIGQMPSHNQAAFTQHAPTALWFRAFNTLGWENFENPRYGDRVADLFFCGAPGHPRATVEGLIGDVGLRPVYVGGPEQADNVDALLNLWMALVRGQGMGRGVAFKLLRR
jgi:predicted dinucleotide-binding enzyme